MIAFKKHKNGRRECMKKALSALLVLIIVLPILVTFLAVPASAESLYIRKIVSVVYDDSGSMKGDKWAYANYAMQAFCGMLNSEDQLYITYMDDSQTVSNYSPEKKNLSAGGIQDSVNSIKNHTNSGSTPYSAVEIAYEKLKSVQDSNPNTQYWLVVITDGDFDEIYTDSDSSKKSFLNSNFERYTSEVMPNGSLAQATFLGIGNISAPDKNEAKGIYTYSASNAQEITAAMSDMADRISGRTRLKTEDITMIDEKTIQVSSAIPLLNIAAFAQGSDAKIVKATHNDSPIPISRAASLQYGTRTDLVGGAYLLGDSQNVIGSGNYTIAFDKEIELENVIVLFEPALEVRVSVTVNGKEIKDLDELDNLMAKDKISVSYKLYEMGTDNEINSSLLPLDTKYEINVYENGNLVKQVSGDGQMLTDFELNDVKTEITSAVTIEGFNPIDFTLKFMPAKYVPKINYTITPSFGSDVKTALAGKISENEDLQVCFTVFADGVQMTDPEAVKAINPVITASPHGNSGDITYTDDGKIVFTPKSASSRPGNEPVFDVTVTCTIKDGTSASEKYSVDASIFEVVFVAPDKTIKKTELYGNTVAATFYVTKEGVKLNGSEVGNDFNITLNKSRKDLKWRTSVSDDGIITVTPYSEEKHEKGFFLTYWFKYFALNGSDITITLDHEYASTEGTLDVVGGGGAYVFFNVLLWFGIECLIAAAIAAYIFRFMTKPRFNSRAVLYTGTFVRKIVNEKLVNVLTINSDTELKSYNKIWYLWHPIAPLTAPLVGGISASVGKKISCKSPYFKAMITPKSSFSGTLTCKALRKHYSKDGLIIANVEMPEGEVKKKKGRAIGSSETNFYFIPSAEEVVSGKKIVKRADVFCYVIEKKQKQK